MRYTFIGVDPGIVDTGLVVLTFDPVSKAWKYEYQVWTDVTEEVEKQFVVDQQFLLDLAKEVAYRKGMHGKNVQTYVEGYRPRGKNIKQDQQMTTLVGACARAMSGSKVLDNTGVRKIVGEPLMKLFGFEFPRTNHADLQSAARIALVGAIKDKETNHLVAGFVRDALDGYPWTQ